MKPPVCRTCGKPHWSRLCDGGDDEPSHVTKNVTDPVTKPVTVTETVTPRQADLEVQNRELHAEVYRLMEEVRQLKQKLAEANAPAVAVSPATSAERMRRLRAKQKPQPQEK